MRGQADVSRTAMGTRPGDSFADIIFGYMWKTVLAKLETFLLTEKAITPLQMHHQLPLFGHSFGAEGSSCFLGPTWMDDLAVCLTTSTAGSAHNELYAGPMRLPLPFSEPQGREDRVASVL